MPAIETQAEADEKMVDLPSTGASVDVTLDDTDVKVNKEEPEAVETVVRTDTASEGEMEDYGKKVQSRIDKLTKKAREAERREHAAVEYARGVQQEAENMRQKAQALDSGYVAEFGDRVEAQMAQAKKELKDAMDLGDVEKQVDVQAKLGRLAIEEERAASHKAQRERLRQEMEARGVNPNQPQMPQQATNINHLHRLPASPQILKQNLGQHKNTWFGEDEPMTLTSFSIHRKLMEEGFDPKSDSYYSEIDNRMKETFPS